MPFTRSDVDSPDQGARESALYRWDGDGRASRTWRPDGVRRGGHGGGAGGWAAAGGRGDRRVGDECAESAGGAGVAAVLPAVAGGRVGEPRPGRGGAGVLRRRDRASAGVVVEGTAGSPDPAGGRRGVREREESVQDAGRGRGLDSQRGSSSRVGRDGAGGASPRHRNGRGAAFPGRPTCSLSPRARRAPRPVRARASGAVRRALFRRVSEDGQRQEQPGLARFPEVDARRFDRHAGGDAGDASRDRRDGQAPR